MQSDPDLLSRAMLDVGGALGYINEGDVDRAVDILAASRHVSVFGCGREGLQIKGFAMRLFHLGRSVSVVGDMTTPAIGTGDLLLLTAGPGTLSTAGALAGVARAAGARVLTITAEPQGNVPRNSDDILVIPAQTMATDQVGDASILPMGSVYEGALFFLFEIMILKLKRMLDVSDPEMRSRHTNLE
jgi:6-phospho-3-hexuloisomerase